MGSFFPNTSCHVCFWGAVSVSAGQVAGQLESGTLSCYLSPVLSRASWVPGLLPHERLLIVLCWPAPSSQLEAVILHFSPNQPWTPPPSGTLSFVYTVIGKKPIACTPHRFSELFNPSIRVWGCGCGCGCVTHFC